MRGAARRDRDVEQQRAGPGVSVADDAAHARAARMSSADENESGRHTPEVEAPPAQREALAQQRDRAAVIRRERQHLVEPRRARDAAARAPARTCSAMCARGCAARSARKPGVAITTSPAQFGARTRMFLRLV